MCLLFHQFPVPVGYAKNVESLQTLKCSYYENGNVFECNYHEEGNLMWKRSPGRDLFISHVSYLFNLYFMTN